MNMKNYEKLIQEILCDKFVIMTSDFSKILNISFESSGIIVTFEYWYGDDELRDTRKIYNSEINAYIFEQSFNK